MVVFTLTNTYIFNDFRLVVLCPDGSGSYFCFCILNNQLYIIASKAPILIPTSPNGTPQQAPINTLSLFFILFLN